MKKLLLGASLLILMNTPSYSFTVRNQDIEEHTIGFFDSRGTKIYDDFRIKGKASRDHDFTKMFEKEFKLTGGGKIFIRYFNKSGSIPHGNWENCSIDGKDYITLTKHNADQLNKLEGVIINMGNSKGLLDCSFTFSK